MNVWFTADCHFLHAKIIEYCQRPFKNIEEMDATIIKNWNQYVKPEDIVYHLGDFCFKGPDLAAKYEKQLNGKIIHILGNHDNPNAIKSHIESCRIEYFGRKFYMIHDSNKIKDIIQPDEIILCGHVHEKWTKNEKGYINVGVDRHNFRLVGIKQIFHIMKSNI